MQCPTCNRPLGSFPVHGVRIEACRECRAAWLDADELIGFLDRAAAAANPDGGGSASRAPGGGGRDGDRSRFGEAVFCPKCNTVAEPAAIGASGVEAQRCLRCGGLWIGRSRLERLVRWHRTAPPVQRLGLLPPQREAAALVGEGQLGRSLLGLVEDDAPTRGRPWATIGIILLNVLLFFRYGWDEAAARPLLLVPAEFLAHPLPRFWTVITSGFLHGGLGHLAGNMYFLWVFGDNLEDRIGARSYLAVYGVCLVVAGLLYAATAGQPQVPTLGASGAVSGVMGGYLVLYPRSRIRSSTMFFFRPIVFTLPAWFYVGVWFLGGQLLNLAAHTPGVAWEAHLAGFAAGAGIVTVLKLLALL